jgi:hypothetical protein
MATGWTFEQVGELTLLDLADLRRYWASHPPLHLMARAYLGIKGESPAPGAVESPKHYTTAEELLGIVTQHPGLLNGR